MRLRTFAGIAALFGFTTLAATSVSVAAEIAAEDLVLSAEYDVNFETASIELRDRRCGDAPGRQPFFFAGTEATFLDVEALSGGRITLSFDDSDTAGTEVAFDDGNGFDDLTVSPRIWVGRRFGEKWGMVARYWHLDDSVAGSPDLAVGHVPLTTFGTYTEKDKLEMYTIDVEGIRTFSPGKWTFDGTIGARQASFGVESQVHAFGVITSGNFANLFLSNGSSFDGTGVTGSLTARRQLGESPWTLYFMGRASEMWGETDSFGRAAGAVASSPDPPLVGAATVTRNNAVAEMSIFELQAGVELDFPLRGLPARAFFRTALEYQNWSLTGPPTGGAGFGGTIGDLTTNSFSSAGLGDASLIGGSVATGFTW